MSNSQWIGIGFAELQSSATLQAMLTRSLEMGLTVKIVDPALSCKMKCSDNPSDRMREVQDRRDTIADWLKLNGYPVLEATNCLDDNLLELWMDKTVAPSEERPLSFVMNA